MSDYNINMKLNYCLVIGCLVSPLACGKDMPVQRQLKSTKNRYSAETETINFYKDLLEKNDEVKRQFDRLLQKSSEYGDTHFGPDDEPTAVEWIPRTQRGGVEEGHSRDTHFLVFQSISFTRPRQHDSDLVVVSEFRAVQVDKEHLVEGENGPSALDSDELTITFLGFRNFKLDPSEPGKTEPAVPALTDQDPAGHQSDAKLEAERAFKEADADLNRTYQQLQSLLKSPQAKADLAKAQRAWVSFRDGDSASRAGVSSDGGSAYAMDLMSNQAELTAERTRQLKAISSHLP